MHTIINTFGREEKCATSASLRMSSLVQGSGWHWLHWRAIPVLSFQWSGSPCELTMSGKGRDRAAQKSAGFICGDGWKMGMLCLGLRWNIGRLHSPSLHQRVGLLKKQGCFLLGCVLQVPSGDVVYGVCPLLHSFWWDFLWICQIDYWTLVSSWYCWHLMTISGFIGCGWSLL